jgi:hypothetical protein
MDIAYLVTQSIRKYIYSIDQPKPFLYPVVGIEVQVHTLLLNQIEEIC